MRQPPRIVIDTNVLVAGLRSKQGWSFALLQAVGTGVFEHVVTVPLVMEYEAVLLRPGMVPLNKKAVTDVVDYLCASGIAQDVHFLWRPKLPDANDDMVLEAAVNGGCGAVVTHNVRDFAAATTLGVLALTPAQFMLTIKEKSR
jgi:predicted nucleic acid-binding protein